ncbi:MAG: DNA alkylation repair protein [Chloroflexota bacterium]
MKAETTFSLKDQLFNPEKVAYLADLIQAVHPEFAHNAFCEAVTAVFPTLELKQRIDHISTMLHKHLPPDYPVALGILLRALPPELDPSKTDDDFGDFIIAPLSHFVATYGCTAEHLSRSLSGLREITKRFSAEDAIRSFINAFPEETMAFLAKCTQSDNYHVRRLASEGTRPKLPWSQKLLIDYHQPLSILDALFADPTRYVTRSVANHLNDISKLDPALVIDTLSRWQQSGAQQEKEMAFIVRHATRTLVKKGNLDALKLMGFGEEPDITIIDFATTTPQVVVGDAFLFSLTIEANKPQKLLVDYLMTFASDGKKAGQKVFKLKQLELKAGQSVTLRKKHPMRLMTTRRLYAGEHQITLQVNGKPFGSLTFDLLTSEQQ